MLNLQIARGRALPLGASAQPDGVNFALLCRNGTAVLLVVSSLEGNDIVAEIALHPKPNLTGDHWHILVNGLPPAFGYGWRVGRPSEPRPPSNPENGPLAPAAPAPTNAALPG